MMSFGKWACSFLVVGTMIAQAQDAPVAQLRPQVAVDSAGIHLDQIIVQEPAAALPHIRLASPPSIGQATELTRGQVMQLVRRHAPGISLEKLAGAEKVQVVRRMRQLAEAEMVEMLAAALQKDYVGEKGVLELRMARAWNTVAVPDEALEVKIYDLPATGISSYFMVRFDLTDGRERVGTWVAAVQANLWKEVPVARGHLRRGQLLQEADIALERRDMLSLRDPLEAAWLADPAFELTENIYAGQPVLSRSVRRRPLVRRGNVVDALLEEGPLQVSLQVQVLEDGHQGQRIRVRNVKSKREFYGTVENESTVLVNL